MGAAHAVVKENNVLFIPNTHNSWHILWNQEHPFCPVMYCVMFICFGFVFKLWGLGF
jgi:hypothetical protein